MSKGDSSQKSKKAGENHHNLPKHLDSTLPDLTQKIKPAKNFDGRLDRLSTSLEHTLPGLIQAIEKSSENNIKFVNLLQENARTQNDNMNYLEKKLEFIDKTMDLKTKHFDEVIKDNMESNDNLVKMVQANLHSHTNLLNSIERNINSIKYWLVLAIVAIGGLIWGTGSHFHNLRQQGNLGLSGGEVTAGVLTSIQEENRRLITKIQADNKTILATIQKDTQRFLTGQSHDSGKKAKTTTQEIKNLITTMQKKNSELLTAIQQTNQDYLTTIISTLRSEQPGFAPESSPPSSKTTHTPLTESEPTDDDVPADEELLE